jgi:ArsR family transcriptional regulator
MTLLAATELFRLLGDPTRVRLLALLRNEELTVAELTQITRLTQSRVSTHLGKLREAALVRDRRAGASTYYTLNPAMPPDARAAWEVVHAAADDPLLEQDARLLAAGRVKWADAVAGRMERHYSPGRTWPAALRGLLGLMRLGRVLDIASGDCALAELIAPRAQQVVCLDNSATVLAAGRRRLRRLRHVGFEKGDMHALPFGEGEFDQIMLLACLCYAERPSLAIAEAARVLKPGGDIVATTLHRHKHVEFTRRYDHIQAGFMPRQLRRWFEAAGLRVALCEVTSRERRSPHFEVITVHASK